MSAAAIYLCMLIAVTYGREDTIGKSYQVKEAILTEEIAEIIFSDVIATQRQIAKTSPTQENSNELVEKAVKKASQTTRLKIEPKIKELTKTSVNPKLTTKEIFEEVMILLEKKVLEKSFVRGSAVDDQEMTVGLIHIFMAELVIPMELSG